MKKSVAAMFVTAGFASMIALGGGQARANEAPANGSHQEDGFQCNHEKGEHFLKRLAKKLDLSDQQTAQLKTSFEKRRAASKPLMVNLRNERKQLRALVSSGNADEAAIRAQSAKVAAVQADLAVMRAQGAKEMMTILTPDQQAKFKALQSKWEEKMKKGHCKKGPHHHEGHEEF